MKLNIKHFVLGSPLLIFPLSSFSKAIIPPFGVNFIADPVYFGAFDGSEGTITLTFEYTYKNTTVYYQTYEYLQGKYDGAYVTESHTDYHQLIKNETYVVNLTFYTNHFINYRDMDITFGVVDDKTHTLFFDKTFTIYKKDSLNMNPTTDDEKIYQTKDTIFCLTNGKTYHETFDFSLNYDVFANEEYYQLDISNQSFNYSCVKPFVYKTAELLYQDVNDIFPYLSKDRRGYIHISLKLTQTNNRLQFSFNDLFWVNPHTLQISESKRLGFIRTNKVYLPLGKKDILEGSTFKIKVSEAGVNSSSIEYELTYYSSNNLFGYCENSDYCIKGGNI